MSHSSHSAQRGGRRGPEHARALCERAPRPAVSGAGGTGAAGHRPLRPAPRSIDGGRGGSFPSHGGVTPDSEAVSSGAGGDSGACASGDCGDDGRSRGVGAMDPGGPRG